MGIFAQVGDILTCPYCVMPLYKIKETVMDGDKMKTKSVEGIGPVKDPEYGERVKCHYCLREINNFRKVRKNG